MNNKIQVSMKTIIAICISFLLLSTAEAQEWKYFTVEETDSKITSPLAPKDMVSRLNVSSAEWKMSGLSPKDPFGLKKTEIERFKDMFVGLSEESLELLRNVSYIFYINKDWGISTYVVYVDKDKLSSMPKVEKFLYDFAKRHADVSYVKPYVIIPKDYQGSLLRVSLQWFME